MLEVTYGVPLWLLLDILNADLTSRLVFNFGVFDTLAKRNLMFASATMQRPNFQGLLRIPRLLANEFYALVVAR